ncbi:MAG: ASKHA domain-containing protein [Gracilibacteraceae bacterium]|jgi:uncharacterized 2Fe-2S/4Fe-4S cluster protein (DUF4445 family)|nr:ASKHA domain-containing protein [Gracilibacteraceae bacterium]
MAKITFMPDNITVEAAAGTSLLAAARMAGLALESPCDGIGTCGKCKARVTAGRETLTLTDDRHKLSAAEAADGFVLACQAAAGGDVTVETVSGTERNKTLKILSEGRSFSYDIVNYITKTFAGGRTTVLAGGAPIGAEDGDTAAFNYGLAVDIGTTTLVCALIDALTGEELATVSALNPQSLRAQDVLTRIKFASTPAGLQEMHSSISRQFRDMVSELCGKTGVERRFIYEAVYSGNTTMITLAAGVDPASLGKYPYTPRLRGGNHISAPEHGLDISPFGLIYLPPVVSAYVGPDITSGILAVRLHEKKGTTLFIDIGTNGEMAIAKSGSLSATSTAAGPAFEGMNITHGMRADAGAIEYFAVREDGETELRTIGGVKPVGICGSGLFDIVGELARVGVIGASGRFAPPRPGSGPDGLPAALAGRVTVREGKPAFLVADGVYLTQSDVRQVQLAKGAVRAGVEALLRSENVGYADVTAVQIAGSFGYHLQAKSLVNLALLPPEFADRIEFVGNTSKSGARAFLLNVPCRGEMEALVQNITCLELADQEGFDRLFVKSMSFT